MNVDPLKSDAACVPVDSELTSAGAAGGAVTVTVCYIMGSLPGGAASD